MEIHLQIGLVLPPARDHHILRLVKPVNDRLLHPLVLLIVQRIYAYGLFKYFLKVLPDGRLWKGDDGKAGLVSRHVVIAYAGTFIGMGNGQLLLVPA